MQKVDLGAQLKMLRKEKNLTQNEIAKILNMNSVTYLHYEKNQRQPSLEQLCLFADYFDVSVDFLLGRTNF